MRKCWDPRLKISLSPPSLLRLKRTFWRPRRFRAMAHSSQAVDRCRQISPCLRPGPRDSRRAAVTGLRQLPIQRSTGIEWKVWLRMSNRRVIVGAAFQHGNQRCYSRSKFSPQTLCSIGSFCIAARIRWSMKHAFFCAQLSVVLVRTDWASAVRNHPLSGKPVIRSGRRVLEHPAGFHVDPFTAAAAHRMLRVLFQERSPPAIRTADTLVRNQASTTGRVPLCRSLPCSAPVEECPLDNARGGPGRWDNWRVSSAVEAVALRRTLFRHAPRWHCMPPGITTEPAHTACSKTSRDLSHPLTSVRTQRFPNTRGRVRE